MTDSEHGKGQMPPYVTLGLAARKALPGSRAAEKDIDSSTRGMGPAVVVGQDLTEAAGPVRNGAVANLAAGDRQLGDGHRKTAGR